MSLSLNDTKAGIEMDEVKYVDELEHKEEVPSKVAGEISYPDSLRAMPEAPTPEMLRYGFELQEQDGRMQTGASVRKEWRMILLCLPYILSSLGVGYDNGASGISTAMPAFLIKFGAFDPVTHSLGISSVWVSLWSSMTSISVAFGCFACSFVIDRFGPRVTNFGANVWVLPGIALQCFATSKGMLLAGKMLAAVGNGFLIVSASNFISESTTIKLRGPLSTMLALAGLGGITLGITAGFERITFVFDDWLSWRMVLAIQFIFPTIVIGLLLLVPTSPAYLVKKGRPAEAARVIGRLFGTSDEAVVRGRLAVIQHTVATEQEMAARFGEVSFKDLFRDPIDRHRTYITIWVWVWFSLAGASFLGNGLYFFAQQGLDIVISTQITLGMLALSAMTQFLTSWVLNRYGRRFCYIWCNLFHCGVMTLLGCLGFANSQSVGWAVAVVLNFAICTAQLSTGGAAYALNAELSSLRLRGKTMAFGLMVQYLVGWLATFVTPYIFQTPGNLGAKCALIFAATTFMGIVWAFFYLPETLNRTSEEIDALFQAKINARLWKNFDTSVLLAEGGH